MRSLLAALLVSVLAGGQAPPPGAGAPPLLCGIEVILEN